MAQEKLLLNIDEAAELLGISPAALREQTRERSRCRQRHPVPYARFGRRYVFRRAELERWANELEANGRKQ